MGLIIGTSLNPNFKKEAHYVAVEGNLWMGFPSILQVLPEGNNVRYYENYKDVLKLNDKEVDLYLFEAAIVRPPEDFIEWASKIPKEKIIVGGSGIVYFAEDYVPYATKLIYGKCDDIYATIEQKGQEVSGVCNFKKMPRYDLYPLKKLLKEYDVRLYRTYGLWTQSGCYQSCDFCYQTTDKIQKLGFLEKPLDYLEEEIKYMKNLFGTQKYGFTYDANFTQSKYWREKLVLLNKHKFSETFSLYASAETLTNEDDIKFLVENNVVSVKMGVEDFGTQYPKNINLKEVTTNLMNHKLALELFYIINPMTLMREFNKNNNIYDTFNEIMKIAVDHKPLVFVPNILKLYPGTQLAHKIKQENPVLANKWLESSRSDSVEKSVLKGFFGEQLAGKLWEEFTEFHYGYYHSHFYKEEVLAQLGQDNKFIQKLDEERPNITSFNEKW